MLRGYPADGSITELQRRLGFGPPMIHRCVDKALAAGAQMGLKDKYPLTAGTGSGVTTLRFPFAQPDGNQPLQLLQESDGLALPTRPDREAQRRFACYKVAFPLLAPPVVRLSSI